MKLFSFTLSFFVRKSSRRDETYYFILLPQCTRATTYMYIGKPTYSMKTFGRLTSKDSPIVESVRGFQLTE